MKQLNNDRGVIIPKGLELLISWSLKIIILIAAAYTLFKQEYFAGILLLVAFFISALPTIIEWNLKASLPRVLDFFITLTFFLAALAASGWTYFDYMDKYSHFISGIAIGLIVFSALFILNYHTNKIKLDLKLMFIFTFMFTIFIGLLWEIIEWVIRFFKTNDAIGATVLIGNINQIMLDLLADIAGALVVSVFCILWLKSIPKSKLNSILNIPQLNKFVKKTL